MSIINEINEKFELTFKDLEVKKEDINKEYWDNKTLQTKELGKAKKEFIKKINLLFKDFTPKMYISNGILVHYLDNRVLDYRYGKYCFDLISEDKANKIKELYIEYYGKPAKEEEESGVVSAAEHWSNQIDNTMTAHALNSPFVTSKY